MRTALLTTSVLALALGAAACGGSSGSSPAAGGKAAAVAVALTDKGCAPTPATAAAGPMTFTITSTGSKVSEVELLNGTKILGEKENLAAGLDGSFSLNVPAGSYEIYCPGADTERSPFVVTAADGTSTAAGVPAAALAAYSTYVQGQSALLTTRTAAFVAAVQANDLAKAQALYADARAPYERIEPVAESFGDLDPRIDARINDVPKGQFQGYHRLEQALFEKKSLAGMSPVAATLLADVKELQGKVDATKSYQAADLANGASGLLDEVAKSKVTGEEERYSHTDLVDFQANIDGSQEAYSLLRPTLAKTNPSLADTIDQRFTDVNASLAMYKSGSTFVLYTALSKEQVRTLAQQVDALAEPLSQVAALVVA